MSKQEITDAIVTLNQLLESDVMDRGFHETIQLKIMELVKML